MFVPSQSWQNDRVPHQRKVAESFSRKRRDRFVWSSRFRLRSAGVKALDHDDGSSFFYDHHNVIYMGWGQKTFEPSPGEMSRNSPTKLSDNCGAHSLTPPIKLSNN